MTGTTIDIVLIIVCAGLEGLGQVFLKKSVLTQMRWPLWISAGIAVLALEALVYTEALKYLTVTAAFTILSLNLIAVALFSQWFLRERVTRTRWIGVGAALVTARTL